jgi:hypothetical protein
VAAPTSRHVAAAAALAAVQPRPYVQPDFAHSDRVATVLSRAFTDATIHDTRSIDGVTFLNDDLPPFAVLPSEARFDRATAEAIPTEVLDRAAAVDKRAPDRAFQRACLEPVVVLTHRPDAVVEDLADLGRAEPWWNPLQALATAAPKAGVNRWFRRPVLVMSPAEVAHRPWLHVLPVAAVIVVGYAAWASPARHTWSRAPHTLVLNQRSTTDLLDFRVWFDGLTLPALDVPVSRDLRQQGLTVSFFGETPVAPGAVAEEIDEEDEWEF